MKARMQGKVLLVQRQKFGQGDRQFTFLEAKVQTDVADIDAIRFTDDWPHETPRAGDVIDVQVEIGGFSGRNGLSLNATAVQPHSDDFILSLHDERPKVSAVPAPSAVKAS